jgi:competence protein ComEC
MFYSRQKISLYILTALFLAAVLVWSNFLNFGQSAAIISGVENKEAKIIFFDVGQGSSVFIEAANSNQILIDGGPGSQILNKLGETMPFFDRDIDVVILTHPDADHLNGLVDVLKKYRIGQIVEPCIGESGAAYGEWNKLIEEKKIQRICAKFRQKIKLAEDIELNVLYPFESLEAVNLKNTNDASVVMMFAYGEAKILLTGDAEEKTEYQLINSSIDLKAQILQIGHHGSKSSTSESFLKAVNPKTAVIQVGKNNRYGHPSQEVLNRLKSIGSKILRTDLDGDIEFLCDARACGKQ